VTSAATGEGARVTNDGHVLPWRQVLREFPGNDAAKRDEWLRYIDTNLSTKALAFLVLYIAWTQHCCRSISTDTIRLKIASRILNM